MGKLYLVATPIGNLRDITLRALDVLKEVQVIACEDTRNTRKLLNFYGIEGKRLISYHDHNEEKMSQLLINILKEKDIALVSDAGTPCISDPGYKIVKLCRENSIDVVPIPGAFAGAAALSVSGLPTDRFLFAGFLSHKEGKKVSQLKEYINCGYTFILYESPSRVVDTLEKIMKIDEGAFVVVAKEITKIHEKFVYGNISKVLQFFSDNPETIRGEFVIIVSPSGKHHQPDITEDIKKLLDEGKTSREIAKIISTAHKIPKNAVYRQILEITQKD